MKKEKEGMMQWIAADKDSCCGDFKPDNMKSNHNANDETKGESPHFVATLHRFYSLLSLFNDYDHFSLYKNLIALKQIKCVLTVSSNKENASPNILI